jgi:hypothetical protein
MKDLRHEFPLYRLFLGAITLLIRIQILNDDVFLSSPPRMFPSRKYQTITNKERKKQYKRKKETIKKKRKEERKKVCL